MCGIVGFVSNQSPCEKHQHVRVMMDCIRHRGPDDADAYVDDGVALGFQRLAIIDLVSGKQPLDNENGRFWIVFNGEIYNFQDLRRQLTAKGHRFKTKSDTEVILHAYEQWGAKCLAKLRGMFAFAIWDKERRELFAAVDRIGIKPLYYAAKGALFLFASEAKAIVQSPLYDLEVDYEVLPFHMAFLTAPFPLTMFRGVFKLEPGHFLRVSGSGVVRKHQYWDLPVGEDEQRWRERPFERIADSLELATQSQMIADVPSGGFLSGGIDSSAICHFMSQHKDDLDTYFLAFRSEDVRHDVLMDEGPFAKEMAQAIGSNHHATYADTSGLDELLPRLVWHMDEPIGDPAALASYWVSKQASHTLTVLLSGVGGDEVFAGYPRYLAMAYLNRFQRLPRSLRSVAGKLGERLPGGKAAIFRTYQKFMNSAVEDPLEAYLRMLTYFGPIEQRELFTRDFWEAFGQVDIYQYHRRFLEKHRQQPLLNRIQYLDFKTFLPCLNLMYTDKMSMAASIEVRVPFLDDDFIAEMCTLPARLKLRGRIRKYALKRAMEPRLPKSIVWRRKAGFGSPVHAWIRGRMRDFIEAYLGESRLAGQGIFNPRYVRRLLDRELSNRQYLSNHIWQLLTFQLWQERFVELSTSFNGKPKATARRQTPSPSACR